MTDGGWNEPAPVVHDGVLYLNNMGNVIQALDAATRRADLGEPRRPARADRRRDARPRDLRRQAVHRDDRRAARRARRAHAAKSAWETIIGDRTEGASARRAARSSSAARCCKAWATARCSARRSASSAPTTRRTAGSSGSSTRSRRPARRAATRWGDVQDCFRAGGDTWITGSYDPDLDTTYWGVAQAKPWMPASRGNSALDRALYTSTTLALNPNDGTLEVVLPARARRSARPRRGLRARARRRRRREGACSRSASPASCGSSIARAAASSTTRRRCSRTSSTASIPRPASRATAPTSSRGKVGEWVQGCPSTEGGHNWQAMTLSRADARADHSAEPKLHRDPRPASRARRGRRQLGRRPALLRDAGHRRQHRQARGLRHAHAGGALVARAARAVPDGGAVDARRRRVRRRPRPPASRPSTSTTGEVLWETRLTTSVQGFPITFSAGGRQYVAVTTGVGGGSPRVVPSLIAPEIHHPANGNALYVFALPRAATRACDRDPAVPTRRAAAARGAIYCGHAPVAQWIEHCPPEARVGGSNPSGRANLRWS